MLMDRLADLTFDFSPCGVVWNLTAAPIDDEATFLGYGIERVRVTVDHNVQRTDVVIPA